MRPSKRIRPVTYLRARAAKLRREVHGGRGIVIMQNGRAQAVLLDVASFEALTQARAIVQLVEMSRAQVRAGQIVSHVEAMSRAAGRFTGHTSR